MKIIFLLPIAMLFLACESHESYTITGTLYFGHDLVGLSTGSIDLNNDGTMDENAQSSPVTGIFKFENVPPGTHKISAIAYVGEDTIQGSTTVITGRYKSYHVEIGKVDEPGHHH